jgi:hypothetical protein
MDLTYKNERKYWWKIEIILKSGEKIEGYDKNEFDSSLDVAKKYLSGDDTSFIILGDRPLTKSIIVRIGEISAMTISVG